MTSTRKTYALSIIFLTTSVILFMISPYIAPSFVVKYSPALWHKMIAGIGALSDLERWSKENYKKNETHIAEYLKSRNVRIRRSAIRCVLYATREGFNSIINENNFFGIHDNEEDPEAMVDILYVYGFFSSEKTIQYLISIAKDEGDYKVRHAALGSLMLHSSHYDVQDLAKKIERESLDSVELYMAKKILEEKSKKK